MGASPGSSPELDSNSGRRAGIDVGVILTGGKSSRMGTDKALLIIEGRTLVERLDQMLRGAGARRVVAIGGNIEAITRLGIEAVADHFPGEGPLGGLLTAADELRVGNPWRVGVIACDLPMLRAATLRRLAEALPGGSGGSGSPSMMSTAQGPVVAVPVIDGIRQVHVLVMTARALAEVGAALFDGERSLQRALGRVDVVDVAGEDPDELRDLDRPEDVDDYHQRSRAAVVDAPRNE